MMKKTGPLASRQVQQSRQELVELNERFRSRHLLSKSFYAQLEQHGCDTQRSVLVELVPDGASTYSGKLIRQDGTVLSFDIDLDSPDMSKWDDVTRSFQAESRRLQRSRPRARPVIAYELLRDHGNS
jgi:hypothetical protein